MEFSVLSNNLKMPMMGFGVFQVTDKDVCKQSVLNAIRTGYRLIDTERYTVMKMPSVKPFVKLYLKVYVPEMSYL